MTRAVTPFAVPAPVAGTAIRPNRPRPKEVDMSITQLDNYTAAKASAISTPTISRFERWAPIAGIVFVLLMVGGGLLVSDVPNADATNHEIAGYLADGDNHARNIIGAYLWVTGAIAFLCFLTRRAEGGRGTLSTLTYGAGVAFAAVWMVSAAAYAAVAFAVGVADAPVSDPDLVRVLPAFAGLLLLVGGGFAGALLLTAASAVIIRTGALPRWLGRLGIGGAIVLLFDLAYLNIFPLWVWVFIASVVMLRRREPAATTAASPERRATPAAAA